MRANQRHIEAKNASPSNIEEIVDVFRATRESDLPYLPQLHKYHEDVDFFRERVFGTDEVVIVVEDKKIVGFCAFRDGWVDHLYVLPEYQGRGIGSVLLKKAMETYPQLQLWIFQRNDRAKKFYEANGFKLAEATEGLGNEEQMPDARYIWSKH